MSDGWSYWSCSYQFEGRTYAITLRARSEDEARARLRAVGMTGTVDGEQVAAIPVNSVTLLPVGIAAASGSWLRNWFGRLFQ